MDFTVERDGEQIAKGQVDSLGGIPPAVFALSQHHGGGEFIARVMEDGEMRRVFRLESEWLED